MADSWLCVVCSKANAKSFCYCNRSETLLCEGCFQGHYSKFPGRFHQNLPLTAFGPHRNPGYFERLQARIEAVEDGKQRFEASLTEIDTCVGELTAAINSVIEAVWTYGQTTVAELTQRKVELQEKIHASIEEVEGTMYEEEPQLKAEFSAMLRSTHPIPKLFSYRLFSSDQIHSVIKLTCNEKSRPCNESYPKDISEEGLGDILPQINRNSLTCHNLRTGEVTKCTLSVTFSIDTVFCLTDNDTVLCIGGSPATTDNYLLSLSDHSLSQQPPMHTARYNAGVVKHASFVFVFGGYDGSHILRECEKFSITEKSWIPLPDMLTPRCDFTPCLDSAVVYFPVISRQANIQTFSLTTESYRTLHSTSTLGYVSFIVDGEVVVIYSSKQVGKWFIGSEVPHYCGEISMNDKNSGKSNTPPRRFGRNIYWVNYNSGRLVTYNIDTSMITD